MIYHFDIYWSEYLGGGGEGHVVMARCRETSELCAFKISNSNDLRVARASIEREVDRLLRVHDTPGVARMIAYNIHGPIPFIALELAAAGTLKDHITSLASRKQVYHPVYALRLVRQILVAVGNVHERGLVHRDIKPANVLMTEHGPRLSDFGTGRSISRPWFAQTRAFVGTEAYASPEQQLGYGVDHRTDLWSVGVVLYELLLGRRPDVFGGPVALPSRFYTNVLPSLDRLSLNLLAASKYRRPQSAKAAIVTIDSILAQYRTKALTWRQLGLRGAPYGPV